LRPIPIRTRSLIG